MPTTTLTPTLRLALLALTLSAGTTFAQSAAPRESIDILIPQTRRINFQPQPVIKLDNVGVKLSLDGQVAVTELELTVSNPSSSPRQAELMLPVPDGASVRSLQYDGTGPEPTAKLLPRDEARRIYDSIVSSMRDPALLEFAGQNVIRTSAFPVPPGATQKLRITYEQVLTLSGNRLDWILPRTESLAGNVPWSLTATIRGTEPIASVFSPSHELTTQRTSPTSLTATATSGTLQHAGSLRLSVVRDAKGLTEPVATVFTTPDPDPSAPPGSGYFMMLVTLPESSRPKTPREITLVLDRSGSMAGAKFTQAISAAERVLHATTDTDRFNIVDYSDGVAAFKPAPIPMTPAARTEAIAYLQSLKAAGGTNIRDALAEALRPAADPASLPIMLFMTDGRPTVGETGEAAIRAAAKAANLPSGNTKPRRIFSFGVGWDVNSPLLTSVARDARGSTTFVTPDEDIEVKVSQVFERLSGPTLSSPTLAIMSANRETPSTDLVDVMPQQLPDYFAGEQIVLTGRYRNNASIRIDGDLRGSPTKMHFDIPTANASLTHSFVSRSWATQRVAWLVEQIRTNYADKDVRTDPAGKELVDEIVRLSTKFGILTEYTSFLSTEPTVRYGVAEMRDAIGTNIQRLNVQRVGGQAFSQDRDAAAKSAPAPAAAQNSNVVAGFVDGKLVDQRLPVQNIANRAFFQRGNQWTQGDLIAQESAKPDLTVTIGTPEYSTLASELIADGLAPILALPGDVLVQHRNQLVKLINTQP